MVGGGLQAGVAGRFGCMGDKMMMSVCRFHTQDGV